MNKSDSKKLVASSTDKKQHAPVCPKRKSVRRIHGQKPAQFLNPSTIRRICRLPPEKMQPNTNAKVRYRNPEFRRVDDPGAVSACNVCEEVVHTPRRYSDKVEQATQTEPSCSGSLFGDQSSQMSKQSNRMSGESSQELHSDAVANSSQAAA
ncbi:uncharacterized protein LOC111079236 [Drosophila obscura]|uniref:uncharacterized protein LOC111079236 n=1 Tax=Drosophila obscura TaxID=7282 RepID=UPI001BB25196|nr:uncharacterized protein LOC111079236 [Drosophila obscura]